MIKRIDPNENEEMEATLPTQALTDLKGVPPSRMKFDAPAGEAEPRSAPPAGELPSEPSVGTSGGPETFGTTSRGFKEGELILRRYKVESVLGRGGMGIVYKCVDIQTDLRVAVKTLPPALSTNAEEMEEIKDNYKLVERLHHPHIADAKNIERDETTGQYFLIMEYVDGINLRQYRKKNDNAISMEEMVPIARQIAAALDFGHSEQIIHRDIKPSNIMITSQGKVKLLDYGIASQYHESMSRVTQQKYKDSGTGPYMAPEQWTADYQDAKTDQYALAVVVYEMVTGAPPFMNPDPVILGQMVRKEPPRKPESISAQSWGVMQKALAKKRKDRFESCTDFVAALDDSLNGIHSQAARKKARIGIFAAAAVLALLIVAGLLHNGRERSKLTAARDRGQVLASRASILAANGQFEEAVDLARRALEEDARQQDARALLAQMDARGRVAVVSDPPGAEVWRGDRRLGVAPLTLEALPDTPLQITLRAEGYEPRTETVRVAPRAETRLAAALTGIAGLRLVSDPPGAEVFLNGVSRGITPLELDALEPGEYRLRAARDGYRDLEKTVRLAAGPARLEELALAPRAGTVRVETTPPGAEVRVGDRTLRGPATFDDLPPGPVEIQVSLPGFLSRTVRGEVVDGEILRQAVILQAWEETPQAEVASVPAPATPPEVAPQVSRTRPADPPAAQRPQRARLAVVPAQFEAGVRSTFWREFLEQFNVADPGAMENPALSTHLIDRLVQTRRFDVLERENLRNVVRELEWGQSEWADPANAARVGRQLNADYMVIPVIRNVLLDLSSREIPYVGTTRETLKGHMVLTLRLVEVDTGRIVSASTLTHDLEEVLPTRDFDRRRALDAFLPKLYGEVSMNMTANIVDNVYPIRVLLVDGAMITLNRGEGAMEVGEELEVLHRGEALVDPDTHQTIGHQETVVGKARVERVMANVSVARLLSGEGAVETNHICRRVDTPRPSAPPRTRPELNW